MRRVTLVIFLVTLPAFAARVLPPPRISSVVITTNVAALAQEVLVGEGIPLPSGTCSRAALEGPAARIVWRQTRAATDNRAGRHVAYRQWFVTPDAEAELFGSEVILHYSASGTLWGIAGAQFTGALPSNTPTFSALDAVDRALERVATLPEFAPVHAVNRYAAARAKRASDTRLKVVNINGAFRYAYFTFATDSDGAYQRIIMDAESEEILAIVPVNPQSNCAPSPNWQAVSAVGEPVRPDLRSANVTRALGAITATSRPSPFNYEAHWWGSPALSILQKTTTQEFMCNYPATSSYTLFPLLADNGTITYKDRSQYTEWKGYAAGDALYNTKQTMAALSYMGRSSWDGNNGDANVLLEHALSAGGVDYGYFLKSTGNDPNFPSTPTLGIAPASLMYNLASSLDLIAHEWGHGVTATSAGFDYTTTVGAQLDEGFADVIGNMVEKLRQPSGGGVEQSSDWTMHEDSATSGYARGAIDDNTGHDWTGPSGSLRFNDRLHRDDDSYDSAPHATGNMLSVVYRLLADGGYNPVCSRLTTLSGCTTNVPSQGIDPASFILFDALQYYVPYNAGWADLPTYASMAAFGRYSDCPSDNAFFYQAAVNDAFGAIGYPRTTNAVACP